MDKKPKVRLLTTDGQMIEVYDKTSAEALYHDCTLSKKHLLFIQIKLLEQTRMIPINRIKEIIFYDTEL